MCLAKLFFPRVFLLLTGSRGTSPSKWIPLARKAFRTSEQEDGPDDEVLPPAPQIVAAASNRYRAVT